MANKYCNLIGANKIKDEYTKINTGFDVVDSDVREVDVRITSVNTSLTNLINSKETTLNGKITTVDNRITSVNTSLTNLIDSKETTLNNRITTEKSAILNTLAGVNTALSDRIGKHTDGLAEKHSATDITYSGSVTQPNVKLAIDYLNTKIENIIASDVEGVSAAEIIDARGGFELLGLRFEDVEERLRKLEGPQDYGLITGGLNDYGSIMSVVGLTEDYGFISQTVENSANYGGL